MPISVSHALSATTPDDPAYEIRPSHWNSNHIATIAAVGSEISGAFSNAGNVSFGLDGGGYVTASANVTAAPSPVNVTGANGSSVNAQTIAFSNANGMSLGVSTAANGATVTGSYTVPTLTEYVFSNSNGVSFGTNGSTVTATVATNYQSQGAYLTTAALSNHSHGFSAAGGSSAFQTLSFSNGGGVSFTNTNGQVGASVATTYRASNDAIGLNTAQSNVTWTVNSSGLSFDARGYAGTGTSATNASITLNSNGLAISVGAAGGADGVNIIAAGTRTATTNGTVIFSNANGISFGLDAVNGSQVTASYTVPTVTNSSWTVSDNATSATVGRLAFTQANGITMSLSTSNNGNHTVFASHNGITSQTVQTQSNVQGIIVSNTTYRTGDVSFSNANGISFGSSAGQAITASYTVPSVTQYFSKTNTTFNGANISGSLTLNTDGLQVSLSVAAPGGGATPVASASNGSFSFTTLAFSNANNVTFGTSAGSIITASVAAPGAAAENNWVNLLGANTAGNTTASGSTIGYSGINLTLSGTNGSVVNISAPATSSLVGFNGNTVSTNGSTISVGPTMGSYFGNMNGEWQNSTVMQALQSTSHIQPFILEGPVSFEVLRIPMSISMAASTTAATTGNSQWSYGLTRSHNFVLYSRGTGASSMSLQSIGSTQFTDRQSNNVSANANSTQFSYSNRYTYYMSTGTTGFTYDYSSSAASLNFHTSGMTAITGNKVMEFPWSSSLAPGQYWLMYGVSSSTASQFTNQGTRWFNVFSKYGISQPNIAFGTIGAATNSSISPFFGLGSFTTAGGGTTASLPISAISTSGSHNKMYFAVARIA